MTDEEYMATALALAKKAKGHTAPNPMVGAIVVKHGVIVGQGYHHKAGGPHAEVYALDEAGENAVGATLYVTLEPCAHYGKTPPCAKRVIASGVSRVVIGMVDPNPLVAGKGIAMLRDAGIQVEVGVLDTQCAALNDAFITYMLTSRPFVTLKSAMSVDGKIATRTGDSQWITNESARTDGHRLRQYHDAILVGIGTVLADNPTLTHRLKDSAQFTQPDVIVLDSHGRTPIDAALFSNKERHLLIAVGPDCPPSHRYELEKAGAEIVTLPYDTAPESTEANAAQLSLTALLDMLGEKGYQSLLVEGGSQVIAAFTEQRLFDKLITYMGAMLIGGSDAIPAIGGIGASTLAEAVPLTICDACLLDGNVRVESYYTERKGRYVHRDY